MAHSETSKVGAEVLSFSSSNNSNAKAARFQPEGLLKLLGNNHCWNVPKKNCFVSAVVFGQ